MPPIGAGNLPVDLALSLAAIIMSLLYAPKARALDSPMLQDFFQAFAWTEAGLEKAVERRNRQLLDPGSSTTTSSNTGWPGLTTQVSFTRVVEAVESAAAYLPGKMAQLAGVQDPETAAAKLREEPCFCMEAAVKLFYWMRLAYREDDVLDHKFVNAAGGLELFDLQHFETIWVKIQIGTTLWFASAFCYLALTLSDLRHFETIWEGGTCMLGLQPAAAPTPNPVALARRSTSRSTISSCCTCLCRTRVPTRTAWWAGATPLVWLPSGARRRCRTC
jgi:hypothetical protein